MRRDPALTFRGALRVLGVVDTPLLEALDKVLGGLLLSAAVGGNTAILALIDPKGEAKSLIRDALSKMSEWTLKSGGYKRQQLIAAAHSIIVSASLFDSLRDEIGPKRYARLSLTKNERLAQVTPSTWGDNIALLDRLVDADIPMPYSGVGFVENLSRVAAFLEGSASSTFQYLANLQVWETMKSELPQLGSMIQRVVQGAIEKYRTDYYRLATLVPEFRIWIDVGEHHATREATAGARRDVLDELAKQYEIIADLKERLSSTGKIAQAHDQRMLLASLNQAELSRPLIVSEPFDHIEHVSFPGVLDSYVLPHYQLAIADATSEPSKEPWWAAEARQQRNDLLELMSAHVCSPLSTRAPMLVFGHPGAGKSLLMKILAGWLPYEAYTVVRVPLRWVDAGAPIYRQIEQALASETHERISWNDVTAESADAIRVVLLDGLDELMQATGTTQTYYLDAIVDFQRREADLGLPVAVIVTSRTVVADRTQIPHGCLMIRLSEFDADQVEQWLARWRAANTENERNGLFRPLSLESALRHQKLSVHPLLLLMLALYAADPQAPDPGDDILTEARLYRRLFDDFVRRELAKSAQSPPRQVEQARVAEQLWQLGLTAFSMFNRGRQYVMGAELDRDYDALIEDGSELQTRSFDEPLTRAQRMIGRFFFVHAAEARGRDRGTSRTMYEFLHPTFGEYLVAATTLDQLRELAEQRGVSVRTRLDRASDLLRSLMSHKAFVSRPTIIGFIEDLFLDQADMMDAIVATLEDLIAQSTNGPLARHDRYNPSGADAVQRLAAYSANLVILRVALGGSLMLEEHHATGYDGTDWRRATVRLWQAGLEAADWAAMCGYLTAGRWGGSLRPRDGRTKGDPGRVEERSYHAELELLGDGSQYLELELGQRAARVLGPYSGSESFLAIGLGSGAPQAYEQLQASPKYAEISAERVRILLRGLADDARSLPYAVVLDLVRRCRKAGIGVVRAQPFEVARIALAHPQIMSDVPELMQDLGQGRLRFLAAAAVLLDRETVADDDLAAHLHDVVEALRLGIAG